MGTWFAPEVVAAFLQVVLIDLVLAGDNAIVVGLVAAGLPVAQRRGAILVGLTAAIVFRIGFASVAVRLLTVVGLLLAGGILLTWVCWKMWRDLHPVRRQAARKSFDSRVPASRGTGASARGKTLGQAAVQIVVADISMSLDNVLAVAGAAREHPGVLILGLVLSIAFMGLAATFIARLLNRYHWVAYIGLAVIVYVAIKMIYEGGIELWPALQRGLA